MGSKPDSTGRVDTAGSKMAWLRLHDSQVAALEPQDDVSRAIRETAGSLADTMECAFTGYASRPALGRRAYVIEESATGSAERRLEPAFSTITYAQLRNRIRAVAAAWSADYEHGLKRDDRICIFGFTSVDFTVLDFATAYVQAVSVPMQTGTAHVDIDAVFTEVKPVTVAVTIRDLPVLVEHVIASEYVKSLIIFEYDERVDSERKMLEAADALITQHASTVNLVTLQDLIAMGSGKEYKRPAAHPDGGRRVASIVYSSGSTGKAKAAEVTERALQFQWTSIPPDSQPVISLCLAPFSHLLGKGALVSVLNKGGTAAFTLAPDMSTLFEDIRLIRPTFLGFFPRIVELVYQHYQNEVERIRRDDGISLEAASALVRKGMSASYLGDRLCSALFGGARIAANVHAFFLDCFGVALVDAYGSTEGGTIAINGFVQRPPVLDYKIRDVPELGYFRTDKPFPRGELCVKSLQGINGYYDAPDATEQLLDEAGYICTGDIIEEYEPDRIAVIGRRNDVLKLSQGEYVAVGALSALFEAGSDLLEQVFVYGNSQRSYLLAVVVPNALALEATCSGETPAVDIEALVREELQRVANQEGIRSFEIPRALIIEHEAFSEQNGLLSGLRKKVRPALLRKYGDRLEALYDEIEARRERRRRELADSRSPLSVSEKLVRLLEMDLDIVAGAGSEHLSFHDLGGDSLGAVLFSLSTEEIFGVGLPADQILSPTGCLASWACWLERSESPATRLPTFRSVHGKSPAIVERASLHLSRFISPDVLRKAQSLPAIDLTERVVLVTGANGFLGRFVCLAWLERMAACNGRVVCIVRAADDEAARERLTTAFAGVDPALESRFRELAEEHLEVLSGALGEPQAGLRDKDYASLAARVDRIVHVAALVNHRLSYGNLFEPNVLGTAQVIELALTTRKKAVDFVSTIAVYPFLDTQYGTTEDAPLKETVSLSEEYAAGYGLSKWAAEHLLHSAHETYSLPVNIFRGDMMLPHRTYRGQVNSDDMFIRLLFSIIHTGLAPRSFYVGSSGDDSPSAHYDGLPVDVVASVVAGAGAAGNASEYLVYNIENYHRGDGISLDTFVSWLEEAGYPVSRVDNYREWHDGFRERLQQLPEDQQRHSALDIAPAFAAPQPTTTPAMSCDRFKALVTSLPLLRDIPSLSQDYFNKCLDDMSLLGLVDRPHGFRKEL